MICEHCKYVMADSEIQWCSPAEAMRWAKRDIKTQLSHVCPRCSYVCLVNPKDCESVGRYRMTIAVCERYREMVPRIEERFNQDRHNAAGLMGFLKGKLDEKRNRETSVEAGDESGEVGEEAKDS